MGYVEDLNDARTKLEAVFNTLLIGVAYAASSYELQKLSLVCG